MPSRLSLVLLMSVAFLIIFVTPGTIAIRAATPIPESPYLGALPESSRHNAAAEFGAAFSPITASTWSKTYGTSSSNWAQSIAPSGDGGYVVAGSTQGFGAGQSDAWVFKLDGSGNIVWQKSYGGSSYDWAKSIVQSGDGGYVVT